MKELVDIHYPHVERIILVMDKLNTRELRPKEQGAWKAGLTHEDFT